MARRANLTVDGVSPQKRKRRAVRRSKGSRIIYVRAHEGLTSLMKAPENQVFFQVDQLTPPEPGTTSKQGSEGRDGRVIPSFNTDGWTCEQCADIIDPRLCIWVNPQTNGIRHAHCRPMPAKHLRPTRSDGRLGKRDRMPGKEGATALELAEVALDLEDIQVAKAYAQVAIARAVSDFMAWLKAREEAEAEL